MRSPGKRGLLRVGDTPAHGGLSLRPQGRARFENFRTEIFGGRSSEADRLQVCRNGCAEMQRGGGRALPPRRAPFGRKESPPWAGVPPDTRCPRLPEDRTARLRRHDPQLRSRFRAIAVCPRGWKRSQDSVSWFLLSPGVVRSSPSRRQMGTSRARQHAGTVRCGWARLPRVDPLCDRMERGEAEANTGRRIASQRSHFCRR